MRCTVLFSLIVAVCAARLPAAEDTSALINQELDKLVKLQVDGVLPQVIQTIVDKTGVPIEPSRTVYSLLPWGDQTNVSARIENQTLRQALTAITRKLGLTYELGTQAVIIQPMPALARLGRRATVQELDTERRFSVRAKYMVGCDGARSMVRLGHLRPFNRTAGKDRYFSAGLRNMVSLVR